MQFTVIEGGVLIACNQSSLSMVIRDGILVHTIWGRPDEREREVILQLIRSISDHSMDGLPNDVLRNTIKKARTFEHRDGYRIEECRDEYDGTYTRFVFHSKELPSDAGSLVHLCEDAGMVHHIRESEEKPPMTEFMRKQMKRCKRIIDTCHKPCRALLEMRLHLVERDVTTVEVSFECWPGVIVVHFTDTAVCVRFDHKGIPLMVSEFERVMRLIEIVSDVNLDEIVRTYKNEWYTSNCGVQLLVDGFSGIESWMSGDSSYMLIQVNKCNLTCLRTIHKELIPCHVE